MKHPQVRAASRKWFSRAMMFLDLVKKLQPERARQYAAQFRRQEKFNFALSMVQAARQVSW